MARAGADRRFLVQERQVAGLRVEGEGADGAALLVGDLVDRVEELAAGGDRQVRRAGRFGRQRLVGQLAGRRVEVEAVDALAVGTCRRCRCRRRPSRFWTASGPRPPRDSANAAAGTRREDASASQLAADRLGIAIGSLRDRGGRGGTPVWIDMKRAPDGHRPLGARRPRVPASRHRLGPQSAGPVRHDRRKERVANQPPPVHRQKQAATVRAAISGCRG